MAMFNAQQEHAGHHPARGGTHQPGMQTPGSTVIWSAWPCSTRSRSMRDTTPQGVEHISPGCKPREVPWSDPHGRVQRAAGACGTPPRKGWTRSARGANPGKYRDLTRMAVFNAQQEHAGHHPARGGTHQPGVQTPGSTVIWSAWPCSTRSRSMRDTTPLGVEHISPGCKPRDVRSSWNVNPEGVGQRSCRMHRMSRCTSLLAADVWLAGGTGETRGGFLARCDWV